MSRTDENAKIVSHSWNTFQIQRQTIQYSLVRISKTLFNSWINSLSNVKTLNVFLSMSVITSLSSWYHHGVWDELSKWTKKRSEKDHISHIHNISAWVNSKNIPVTNIIGKYSRLNEIIIMYKRNLCFALPYIARWVEGCIYRRRGSMQILSSVLLSSVFMKHC